MCKKKSRGRLTSRVGTLGSGPYSRATHPSAFGAWYGMLNKCYDKSSQGYGSDGALGVRVCPEWMDFQAFAAWYEQQSACGCPSRTVFTRRLGTAPVYGPDTCALVPVGLMPALPVYVSSTGGVRKVSRTGYTAHVAIHGRRIDGARRDTPEEARADYLDIRADILDGEAARLDALLTDRVRAMAAAKSAQLRAEAGEARAHAAARRARTAYAEALEITPVSMPVERPACI